MGTIFSYHQFNQIWSNNLTVKNLCLKAPYVICSSCALKVKVSVTQSCLSVCDPMDYSPPGSFVHGVLRARVLDWIAMPFSRGSFHLGLKPEYPTLRQILYHLSFMCVNSLFFFFFLVKATQIWQFSLQQAYHVLLRFSLT